MESLKIGENENMSDDLISKEIYSEETANKVRVSSAEIVVHGTKEKPYYEIEYFDLSDNEMHIGFSSYKLDVVFGYLAKYFEIMDDKEESEHMQDYHIGDLISRKAVLNILTEECVRNSVIASYYAFTDMVAQRVKKLPAAFDREEVIEELKNLKDSLIDCKDLCGECIEIECDQCALKKAIKIVEKGGIE